MKWERYIGPVPISTSLLPPLLAGEWILVRYAEWSGIKVVDWMTSRDVFMAAVFASHWDEIDKLIEFDVHSATEVDIDTYP